MLNICKIIYYGKLLFLLDISNIEGMRDRGKMIDPTLVEQIRLTRDRKMMAALYK